MTDSELLRRAAEISKNMQDLSKYVFLREDEQGKYIEYAFIEGAPHHNRCLSKYVTGNAILKSLPVDKIYLLSSFTCGGESSGGPCTVGHPHPDCNYVRHTNWSPEHPGKCACWDLAIVEHSTPKLTLSIDEFKQLAEEYVKKI